MNSTPRKIVGRPLVALPLLLAAWLGACGGSDESTGAPPARAAHAVIPTLLDNEGQMTSTVPGAEPADAAARTRSTGYATAAQAAVLEQALGDGVLTVDVGCCGADGVQQAVRAVQAMRAARQLPGHSPVLVRGADPRLAAAAAQQLADSGHSRVWMVVL